MALGISSDEVVKTIVLNTGSGHALAVILGSRRLDIRAAERAVGDKHVRLATEEEFEKDFPAYELGAMPAPRIAPRGADLRRPGGSSAMTRWCSPRERKPSQVKVRAEDLFRNEPVTVAPLTRLSAANEELIG